MDPGHQQERFGLNLLFAVRAFCFRLFLYNMGAFATVISPLLSEMVLPILPPGNSDTFLSTCRQGLSYLHFNSVVFKAVPSPPKNPTVNWAVH